MTMPDEDDLLAAELALGLLEAQVARERLRHDAAFAHAHARWQTYAAGLTADVGETPPPRVWSAILARLPANDDVPANDNLRTSLRMWRAGAIAASLLLVTLGVRSYLPVHAPAPAPQIAAAQPAPLVAVLSGKNGVVSVNYDRASGRLASVVSGVDAGPRAVELWVIPADGKPRSLGVLAQGRPGLGRGDSTSRMSPYFAASNSTSSAPSPTGSPTGQVILTGKLDVAG